MDRLSEIEIERVIGPIVSALATAPDRSNLRPVEGGSERVGVERIDFVSAPTRDLERAVRFYRDVLRLPLSVSRPEQGYAEVEIGNVTINLFDPESMGLEFAPNRHLMALRVADVREARRELEAAGVEFEGETEDTGVCLIARFRDPDGNGLLLHRRYAPVTDRQPPRSA